MDKQYQDSIIKVLFKSDMANKMFIEANVKPTYYEEPTLSNGEPNPKYDSTNPYLYRELIDVHDVFYSQESPLAESWIANSMLIFTLLDGWLEDYFNMTEGDSFLHKLKELKKIQNSSPTVISSIVVNVYRIMKIIRNGIQHNLSGVEFDKDGYHIAYVNSYNTECYLEFKPIITRYLYTLCISIIQGYVFGIQKKYRTSGHYEGMLLYYYETVRQGIGIIEDELKDNAGHPLKLDILPGLSIDASARTVIVNPIKRGEDEQYYYYAWYDSVTNCKKADYLVDINCVRYLLPEELGITDVDSEEKDQTKRNGFSIFFRKDIITDKWRVLY